MRSHTGDMAASQVATALLATLDAARVAEQHGDTARAARLRDQVSGVMTLLPTGCRDRVQQRLEADQLVALLQLVSRPATPAGDGSTWLMPIAAIGGLMGIVALIYVLASQLR
jgi:hypothetical protein